MTLLKELITEGKRRRNMKKPSNDDVPSNAKNNLAAKHSVNKTGAGAHVDKNGDKAPRNRQKRNWKKEANQDF